MALSRLFGVTERQLIAGVPSNTTVAESSMIAEPTFDATSGDVGVAAWSD